MSNENKTFQEQMAEISAQVQADATAEFTERPGVTTTPTTSTPDSATADPGAQGAAPTPAAGEPDDGTYGGQYRTREEAVKARHLLIQSLNASKAENDRLKALLAAGTTPAPVAAPPALSPGRVDPTAADPSRRALEQKFVEQYGIDPTDVREFTRAIVSEVLVENDAPNRAMQAADAYILQQYPDFAARAVDIKAFVQANEALNSRFAGLWSQGLFAEALEIAYLAHDNALRAVNIVAAANEQTNSSINADRAAGSMIVSQAGGSREPAPTPGQFRGTAEDMAHVAALRARGRDEEARAFIYGPMLAGIPALNGGRKR